MSFWVELDEQLNTALLSNSNAAFICEGGEATSDPSPLILTMSQLFSIILFSGGFSAPNISFETFGCAGCTSCASFKRRASTCNVFSPVSSTSKS